MTGHPGTEPTTAKDRAAIITGAGSGIGRAVAERLSREHFALTLVGRREDRLRATAAGLGTRSLVMAVDITAPGTAAMIVERTASAFCRVDALINNAGYAPLEPIEKHTPDLVRRVFDVNAIAPADLIAAAWPIFFGQRSGCVVNISSYATVDPFPGFLAYGGAKAALNVYAKVIAAEGRAHNIRGFSVAPGAVETEMLRAIVGESRIPRSRALTPDAVAQVITDCVLGRRDAENGTTILLPSPPGPEGAVTA